jgi:predicted methyltransferase
MSARVHLRTPASRLATIAAAVLAVAATPIPTASVAVSPPAAAAVAAADRSEADRALDAGRRPAEMLSFFGIAPGMRVAELGAGGGYTAELLARVVGPQGKVYAQNSQFLLGRFAQQPWTERLQKPVMSNVVRLDRPFDDPFPEDVRDLDAVLIVLFYHDTYW